MKKILFLFLTILVGLVLTSCSQQKEGNNVPQIIDVKLSILPEKGEVNQPVTFKVLVTQGSEKVDDADEVLFEIWRSKDSKHEQIKVKHQKNGIYQLEKSFKQEGTYYVISHVTARGMHTMPKKEFSIGKPSEPEGSDQSMNGMNMKDKK
ncbi:MAG: FixH family protein [Bacillota bacterium]|nr:FixH family protein [Bacillota bacterium]